MRLRRAAVVAPLLVLVASSPTSGATPQDAPANVPGDVARAISRCWRAPHAGDEVTVRLSFRRDGSIFGKPRIAFMKTPGGADDEAALATSIYAAISACGPLRFTPSLGAAIAGRTFLIRFVANRREQRAAL